MSKKQTRRSISVSGTVYDRLRAHVDANGTTCSGVVEDLLRGFFGMMEREQKAAIDKVPRYERKVPIITMKTDMNGVPIVPTTSRPAKEVVIRTPVLEKNGDWTALPVDQVENGPADRVQVIKDAATAHAVYGKTKAELEERQESEVDKKKGRSLDDMASKIFTF